jgi:aminoglycoside phosphotransferase (APT) family kinase protein
MVCEPDATDLQSVMAQAESVEPWTDVFVDTFAAVHSTPLDALPPSLPRAAAWDSYLDGVFNGYDRVADRYPSSAPVLRHVSRWARSHRPPPVPLALVHGDCQPSNVLITADAAPLVIDWEFAHIGDPREDLGYYTQNPLQPNVYWADPDHFLERYRTATGLDEDQVNAEVVEYFLIIGMAMLLEQLLDAAAAIGGASRPGILAPYLINAISHQYDMFLAISERLP